ncbi:MAG: hypothetical protein JJ992_07005 [Planctomycetes bacterium]|nr:hypothetical protein [Planctomycetota bacterium]
MCSRNVLLVVLLQLGFIAIDPAVAEWSDDPTAPTPVCTADHEQTDLRLVAVDGGFVLTWEDLRRENTHRDLYAQKFTVDGEMLWPENGRVIAAGPDGALVRLLQINAGLSSDGSGGALVAWNDSTQTGYSQAFATRIHADGTVQWGDPGVAIQSPDTAVPLMFNATVGQNGMPPTMGIAADTEGGFFAPVWNGIGRFDAQGRQRTNWFDDSSFGFYYAGHTNPLVPVREDDGRDGVIVIWPQGNLYFVEDIRARKLVDTETRWPGGIDTLNDAWGAVTILDPSMTIQVCRIAAVPDGAGGAITAWIDNHASSGTETIYRIFAQRIDASGNLLWRSDGVTVSGDLPPSCHWSQKLKVVADGESGIVIAWNAEDKLWAQRLDADGEPLWGDSGVLVASSPSLYDVLTTQALVRATDNHFVVLYHDEPHAQLVARKLDSNDGASLWEDGQVVYEGCFSSYYDWAVMVSDGHAGAVVAWPACDGNLYAQRVEEADEFQINAGLNDAWYNSITNGQGLFITVYPKVRQMFVAWFTYDTERPAENVEAVLGEPGHRWLTAQGGYSGSTANLSIHLTQGGVFDASTPPAETDPNAYGSMTVEFADCNDALVTYEIPSLGLSGAIPIKRIVDDNVALCEQLGAP